jgi:purine nucleosidase
MRTAHVPLILDVDTGVDDALALLYACASDDAELVAVTCSAGNATLDDTLRNTRAVLALAGRADVPVGRGSEVPLERPLEITPETHGPHGIGYAELPDPGPWPAPRSSAELIVEAARSRPGEITLVTLGPLTTLAVALRIEPRLPSLLRRWVCMGGAFRVPGNTTPASEWNIHCDPEAARIAFGAWQLAVDSETPVARPLVLGLDVTERARMTTDHVVAIARRAGSRPDDTLDPDRPPGTSERRSVASNPMVRFMADALRFYFEFHARYDGFYGAFVHDPLVVAAALDPSLVRSQPVALEVDAAGGPADGQTVADWRGLTRRRPNADVATEVDVEAFLDRLVVRIGALAARRPAGPGA